MMDDTDSCSFRWHVNNLCWPKKVRTSFVKAGKRLMEPLTG